MKSINPDDVKDESKDIVENYKTAFRQQMARLSPPYLNATMVWLGLIYLIHTTTDMK